MAPSAFLLYILIVVGFSSVHSIDNSTEQTGLYFIKQPKDVIAVKGEPLLLPCSARSTKNKELKLEWLHDGSSVLTDGRRQVLSNGSLAFSKIIHKRNGYSDQGEYRCVITDGNGFLSSVFIYLRVSVMRNFTEHPKSQTVREGSHLRMSCEIESIPDAVITWEHNDHILPQKSSKHRILSGPGINGSVIYIFNAEFEDAGKYRCVATNPLTQNQRQSKRATLAIKAREKPETPKFLSYSHTKIVKEGDTVQLDCVVEGLPFPSLVWTYRKKSKLSGYSPNGKLVASRVKFISVKGSNSVVHVFNSTSTGYNIANLENVTPDQSGFYTCSVLGDSAIEMGIALKVMTHPEFIERPETVTYQAARAVRFRCKVVGNPVPMIIWIKDGFPVKITGRITHNTKVNASLGLRTSEILVASSLASDAGIYQCVAKNPVGMIWSASRLILNATKPAPRPPQNVSCQTLSSTEIAVEWNVSPEMLISGLKAFTIHHHDIDGGEELREAVLPTNRSIIVHSLIPYTNYTFYLRSYSDSASDFSNQVICQTGEEVPESAPDVQLEASTPTSLHLSWTPLTKKQARGIVIEYKIQWRINGAPSTNVHRVSGDVLKYTITDLIPNTEYEVRVIAGTSRGWPSENFPWKLFKLPDANTSEGLPQPNIVLQNVNSSTIRVTWSIPSDLTAHVRGFKIFYRKENDSFQGPISVPANVSEYHITQLDSETLYEVDVLGFTDSFDGTRGRSSVRTLSNDYMYRGNDPYRVSVLEAPVGLGAEPSSRGTINLSWSAPSSGSNVKDYTVCYNPVQNSLTASKSSITCFKSSETKVLISNLEPYTLYEFRVRSNGFDNTYSNFSQSVECYTFEDIPSHVVDIKWKAENKTTISISWKQPKKTNGAILNYTIFYTKDPSLPLSSWSAKVVSGNTFSTYVTDLVPNTEYYMVVRASTSAGLGSYGNPKQVVIPVLMGVASKKTPKSDKDRRNEQYVGITVGLGIGLTCIIICTLCIVCRRRCVKNQAAGEIEHVPGRGTNGTGCFTEREMRLDSQESEFFPYVSAESGRPDGASADRHFDKKGRYPNGYPNGVRMTLLGDGKGSNNTLYRGNINITENPRYDATYTVSPLLGHEHAVTVSSENGYDRDLSSDSDVLNHSKVPLLIGKKKFTETEHLSSINSEDSESEREGRMKSLRNSSSTHEQLNNVNDLGMEQDSGPVMDGNRGLGANKYTNNLCLNENRVLENPDFRFSDSYGIDKPPTKKNGFVLPPKLCNGAADPFL